MTRSLRTFPKAHVLEPLDRLADHGKRACLTEDTSWFPGSRAKKLLDRILEHLIIGTGRAPISYIGISMPMILATSFAFLEKVKAAGIDMFYLVGGFHTSITWTSTACPGISATTESHSWSPRLTAI